MNNRKSVWWNEGNFNTFMYHLRNGEFKVTLGYEMLYKLKDIETPQGELIKRTVVADLWRIPWFIETKRRFFCDQPNEKKLQKYDHIHNEIRKEIARVLSYVAEEDSKIS